MRKHSLICSVFVAGLTGNELWESNSTIYKLRVSQQSLANFERHAKGQLLFKQADTFFSSTTGEEGFTLEGSAGANPSFRLLSACEDKQFTQKQQEITYQPMRSNLLKTLVHSKRSYSALRKENKFQ